VAGEVLARIAELRFVLRERGAGLIERGLIRTRIDLREQLSTPDLLALPEGNIRELSVDLRGDLLRVERLHRAEALQIDRYVLAHDPRGAHCHGGRPRLVLLTCMRRGQQPREERHRGNRRRPHYEPRTAQPDRNAHAECLERPWISMLLRSPTAAERIEQADQRLEMRQLRLRQRILGREETVLRAEHRQDVDGARVELVLRHPVSTARLGGGDLLALQLIAGVGDAGERVLDVAQRGDHRLVVVGEELLIAGLAQAVLSENRAATEDRLREAGGQREHAAAGLEQLRERAALITAGGSEIDRREERRPCRAY